MRTPVVVLSLMLVAFAGCVDESEDAPAVDDNGEPTQGNKKGLLSYEVDPDSANESDLEGAHTHDDWGGTTELTLLDATVETADCADPITAAALAFFGVVTQQEAHVGCASWRLADGAIVPEGTEWLRVEVDASDALDQGGMQLMYANEEVGRQQLDATTEPEFTWRIPVGPLEWDLPHSTQTSWWFLLQPSGNPAILDGSVKVFVVAERMADWKPILGSAHINHWEQYANHSFIGPGVYKALDANVTVEMPSYAERAGSQGEAGISAFQLDDIVAPGATEVTMAISWGEVSNCPAGHECWIIAFINPANSRQAYFAEPVEEGANWAVYRFTSPDPLSPDSTYAQESVYYVSAFVRACPQADIPNPGSSSFFNGCMGEAVASMEAEARVRVEVWDHAANMQAVRERAGITG